VGSLWSGFYKKRRENRVPNEDGIGPIYASGLARKEKAQILKSTHLAARVRETRQNDSKKCYG